MLQFNLNAPKGLIRGESEQDYFATGFLGSTALKAYNQSPRGFYRRHILKDPMWTLRSSGALRLGSYVDDLISGESAKYITVPPEHRTPSGAMSTSKATREWKEGLELQGLVLLADSEYRLGNLVAEQIGLNPLALELIEQSEKQTVVRDIHDSGVPVQARADYYAPGQYLADLKTTSDDLQWYSRNFYKYGYDMQAALYSGLFLMHDKEMPFYHIVAQTTYPYEVRVFLLDSAVIEQGMEKVEKAIEGIAAADWGHTQCAAQLLELQVYG